MLWYKEDLYNRVNQFATVTNTLIHTPHEVISFQGFNSNWIIFENCTFNCIELLFVNINNPELVLTFRNCAFDCDVKILNCVIDEVRFINTKHINGLFVEKGMSAGNSLSVRHFEFSNESNEPSDALPKLTTNFSFKNCTFENFSFSLIEHVQGTFKFRENTIGKANREGTHTFELTTFCNAIFSRNIFKETISFFKSSFIYDSDYLIKSGSSYQQTKFYNNQFFKVDFSNVNFSNQFIFDQCDFLSTAWFHNCKNLSNANLLLHSCKFQGYTLFDDCQFNNLEFSHCHFERKTSFSHLRVFTVKIHQVTFNHATYFDDVTIDILKNSRELINKNLYQLRELKRTLRVIKQELQKTENKIDFNRFRVYEFSVYKRELQKVLKAYKTEPLDKFFNGWDKKFLLKVKRDLFILNLSEIASDYGTDWRRALNVTFWTSLALYTLLFAAENYNHDWNCNNWEAFPIGYVRFFILTDFYNPLGEGRTYIENDGWNHLVSWFIFILGKIVIAFGIYEMIQAFRKFKV